jgi:AAA domain
VSGALEKKLAAAKEAKGAGAAKSPEAPPAWKVKPTCGQAPDGITAIELLNMEFAPPRFLLDNLLTEGLTVLGGKPKHGKSWLALLFGWAVATGESVDGRAAMQGEVLYLALEDTRRRLQGRLAKLRDALKWTVPETLTLQTQWPRASDGGLYHIAEWCDRNKGQARLVIVDTLAKFRTPQKGNASSYADDYAAVGGLKELLDYYGIAGLMLHHTRKLKSDDPFDEISGTLAITGAADSIWMLDTQKKGESARLYVTGRDIADATVPMTFTQDTGRWKIGASVDGIDTTGRESGDKGSVTKVQQCAEWLKDFLRTFAYPSKEIEAAAKAAGYAFSALRDAKASLGREGTGELTNHKFGAAEWWSGLGSRIGWKLRPGRTPDGSDTSDSSGIRW